MHKERKKYMSKYNFHYHNVYILDIFNSFYYFIHVFIYLRLI